jgi:26S proteasome regulatory subunit N2
LQEHALRKLNALIDTNWADVAQLVVDIEALADDDTFPSRELAAGLASKVSID